MATSSSSIGVERARARPTGGPRPGSRCAVARGRCVGQPAAVGERDHQVLLALPDERGTSTSSSAKPQSGHREVVVQPPVDARCARTRAGRRQVLAVLVGQHGPVDRWQQARHLGDDPRRLHARAGPLRRARGTRAARLARARRARTPPGSARPCRPGSRSRRRVLGAAPAMQSTPATRSGRRAAARERVRAAAGPARHHAPVGAEVVQHHRDVVRVVDDAPSGSPGGAAVAGPRPGHQAQRPGGRGAFQRPGRDPGSGRPVVEEERHGAVRTADGDVERAAVGRAERVTTPSFSADGDHARGRCRSRLAYDGRASRHGVPAPSGTT